MERLDLAFRTVLKVPKAALLRDEERAGHARRKNETKRAA
jgi:hypothetical protein